MKCEQKRRKRWRFGNDLEKVAYGQAVGAS
jgi:hypothetical protein